MSTALRFVGQVVAWLGLLLAVAVLAALVLVPMMTGSTAYTVTTGSMRPSMPPGELVVSRPVPPETIGVGDVITYQIESGKPAVATHRVVATGVNSEGEQVFVTKGDANNVNDPERVRAVQVRGEVWYHLPWLGYVNSAITGEHRILLVGAAVVALIGYALAMFVGAARDRRTQRQTPTGSSPRDDSAASPPSRPPAPGPAASGAPSSGPPAHGPSGRHTAERVGTLALVLVAGIAVAVAATLPAEHAHAQPPGVLPSTATDDAVGEHLGLSLDGITWSSTLSGPLFAASPIAPGDELTAVVYARNTSNDPARLGVSVAGTDDPLWRAVAVQVSGSGTTTTIKAAESFTVTGTTVESAPGDVLRLVLAVTLPVDAGNGVQSTAAAFDLWLTLTQTGHGPGVPVGPPGDLPNTGTAPVVSLLVGMIIVAVGITVLREAARRTKKGVEP